MTNLTDYILYELEHNSSPAPVVAVFGDLNYDYIYTSPPLQGGKEVIITDFARTLAGAAGYVACGLAKLGAEVAFFTVLGDDDDGRRLREEVGSRGVGTEGIRLVQGKRSAFTLIFAEAREEKPRQTATYLGPLKDFGVDGTDFENVVGRSNLVYSCNYFILPRLREEIRFVFRQAKGLNVVTAYDANAGDGWEDRKNLATLTNTIYPLTDVVLLNESEARFLTGCDDPAKSAILVSPSSATVVIKIGPRGAVLRHRGRFYRVSAFPIRGRIEDTVGAGDAFQAAFLYYYVRKFPIEICAVMGSANAASTLAFKGGVEGQLDGRGLAAAVRCCSVFDRGGGVISIQR